jgi:hypothetical protein
MRRPILLASLLALVLAAPVAAQSAPKSRDDSLAIGRKYIAWVYEYQTDSLWNRFAEPMRTALGSVDGLQGQMDHIALAFGSEIEVVEETVSAKDGNLVYTREVKFDGRPGDNAVWMWQIAPDGTIVGAGMRPKSQMPQSKPDSTAAKPAD